MENQNTETQKKKWQPPKEVRPEHKDFLIDLGDKLKKMRKEKSLAAAFLCTEIGISRNAYHLMEEGRTYFNIENLLLILNYYNISAITFMKTL